MFTSKISRVLILSGAGIGLTASAMFVSAQVSGSLNPVTALKAMVAAVSKSCYTKDDIAALEARKAAMNADYQALARTAEGFSIRVRGAERQEISSSVAQRVSDIVSRGDQENLEKWKSEYAVLSAKQNRSAREAAEMRRLDQQIKSVERQVAQEAERLARQPNPNDLADLKTKLAQADAEKDAKFRELSALTTEIANAKKKSCVCMKQADYSKFQTLGSQISAHSAQIGSLRQKISSSEANIRSIEANIQELKFYYANYSDTKAKVAAKQTELAAVKKTLAADKAALKKVEAELKKAQADQPKLAAKLAASGGMICGSSTTVAVTSGVQSSSVTINGVKMVPGPIAGSYVPDQNAGGNLGSGSPINIPNIPASGPVPDCNNSADNGKLLALPPGVTVRDLGYTADHSVITVYRVESGEKTQQYSLWCSYGAQPYEALKAPNMEMRPYVYRPHQCADGIDNDGDGLTDLVDAADCQPDPIETQCSDGIDNDDDGLIDENDSDCFNEQDDCGAYSFCDTSCPQYDYFQCQGSMTDGN
ncbi:MAG TPA: hypothetical protein VGE62_01020 [Candidatus Paceibacterota bacterium]